MTFYPALKWLVALLYLAVMVAAQQAHGHTQFEDSIPASDSTLEESPHEIALNFSQAVTPVSVTLVGPDGKLVESVGEAVADVERVVLPVTEPLPTGIYAVSFRVLSGDSHSIDGSFRFSLAVLSPLAEEREVKTPPTPPVAEEIPGPVQSGMVSIELAEKTARLLFLGTLLVATGFVAFRFTIPLPEILDTWVVSLSRLVSVTGLLLALVYFLITTVAVTGMDAFQLRHLYLMMQTSIGTSILLAAVGFLILAMSAGESRVAAGVGAAALIISRVVTGHPASQEPMLILVPGMAVHIAAAGFWFASLWVLLRLLRKGPLAEAPQILRAFARVALWSVGALLLVGAVMAAIHLKSIDALLHSDYGETLLWKLGGVAGLLVLAAINKLVLTPDLLQRFDAGKLKASIRVEALLMIAVIGVSTLLAASSPPNHGHEKPSASNARGEIFILGAQINRMGSALVRGGTP